MIRFKYRSVLADMPVLVGGVRFCHGTPQTGPDTAGHHGLDGDLATKAPRLADAQETGEHGQRSAGVDNIGGCFVDGLFHGVCDEALISGAAVIRSDVKRHPQPPEGFPAKEVIQGPAPEKHMTPGHVPSPVLEGFCQK